MPVVEWLDDFGKYLPLAGLDCSEVRRRIPLDSEALATELDAVQGLCMQSELCHALFEGKMVRAAEALLSRRLAFSIGEAVGGACASIAEKKRLWLDEAASSSIACELPTGRKCDIDAAGITVAVQVTR